MRERSKSEAVGFARPNDEPKNFPTYVKKQQRLEEVERECGNPTGAAARVGLAMSED